MTCRVHTVVLGALFGCAVPLLAFAKPSGVEGYSGQQGSTCVSCHDSGAAVPTVTFEGPATVQPGQSQQYTVVITGGPASEGGIGISVDDPTATLQPGEGSRLRGRELSHSSPKPFAAGEVRFPFTVVAPSGPGVMTLYAAGMSANGTGGTSGDGVGTSQLQVQVASSSVPGAPAPAPSPTPEPEAPAPATEAQTPTPAPSQPSTSAPTVEDASQSEPQTGCTAATGAPALAALAALASLARRRKR